MRQPFPISISVGTDIVKISRILEVIRPSPRKLFQFTRRLLHETEFRHMRSRFPWLRADSPSFREPWLQHLSVYLAGRWAAKEAAKKAWEAPLVSWRELLVEIPASGSPRIVCFTEMDSSTQSVTEQVAQLSISHDGDYAVATVLATPLHTDILTELSKRKAEADAKVGQNPWSKSETQYDIKSVSPA